MDAAVIGSSRIYCIGLSSIQGTVTRLGVAGSYRVRLYERNTGHLVLEQWSAPDGAYLFTGISSLPYGYFVIAFDHAGYPVNAAISDYITAEPMP